MGGINPSNISSSKQLIISQQVTRHLFSLVSNFYAAQENIETVVLLEPSVKDCLKFLEKAKNNINLCKNTAKDLPKYILKSRDEFKESEIWLTYLDYLNMYSEKLHEYLTLLSLLLQDDAIIKAIKEKDFQTSLWENNANSGIQRSSIECSALLSKALDLHRNFVINSNKVILS